MLSGGAVVQPVLRVLGDHRVFPRLLRADAVPPGLSTELLVLDHVVGDECPVRDERPVDGCHVNLL